LATLATQVPLQAAEELHRAVVKLGLKGGIFFSHIKGEYLDDEKYWPIFEAASDLDVPLYLHPRGPSPGMAEPYLKYPVLAGATLGYAAEAGLHAMRLICSGVFDRYPNLKIILGHMGEALPYWLWRIDKHWDKVPIGKELRKRPGQYIKDSFFITTSGMFYTPAFMCAYLALGADKILFAVDYPFESIDAASSFAESLPISDADREKICCGNAEKLFKLNG
jgi:2,3-dihydroxybenzoate decarboxylase